MERAMLFDEATVTTTEQAVAAAAQKALPSHRLRYAVLLVLNVPCLITWLMTALDPVGEFKAWVRN
jgi:hypothetical protein